MMMMGANGCRQSSLLAFFRPSPNHHISVSPLCSSPHFHPGDGHLCSLPPSLSRVEAVLEAADAHPLDCLQMGNGVLVPEGVLGTGCGLGKRKRSARVRFGRKKVAALVDGSAIVDEEKARLVRVCNPELLKSPMRREECESGFGVFVEGGEVGDQKSLQYCEVVDLVVDLSLQQDIVQGLRVGSLCEVGKDSATDAGPCDAAVADIERVLPTSASEPSFSGTAEEEVDYCFESKCAAKRKISKLELNDELPQRRDSCIQLKSKKGRRVLASLAPSELIDAPVTDYERERADNILRNQAFLQSLGITTSLGVTTTTAVVQHSRATRSRSSTAHQPPSAPHLPLRRSTRFLNSADTTLERCDEVENRELKAVKVDSDEYEDSLIVKNVPDIRIRRGDRETGSNLHCSILFDDIFSCKGIKGFRPLPVDLYDPKLTRIYTMSAASEDGKHEALVAAGGHRGRIAVFKANFDAMDDWAQGPAINGGVTMENSLPEEEAGPALSWKGSSGWISSVLFLSQQTQGDGRLLLSSANDGNIMLWDINKQRKKIQRSTDNDLGDCSPLLVADARSVHSNGIFSMHELGGRIATASKDSTIGCSVIRDSCIVKERSLFGHHSGHIRGVSFRNENILADCGADSLACILDLRLQDPVTIVIHTSCPTGVNVVEWCPSNESILLSASKDPHLLLHDIRNSKEPLYKLSGHVNPQLSRCSHIYRPAFVVDGDAVATPGQGSCLLSLYSVRTGNIMSRCDLGFDATMVMSNAQDTCSPVWVAGKCVTQLVPVRHSDT